jgi:hypothetical protein
VHDSVRGAHTKVTADLGRSTPFGGGQQSLDNLTNLLLGIEKGEGRTTSPVEMRRVEHAPESMRYL